MDILDSLLSDAEAWLAQDPDPVTSAELARVIAAVRTGDAEAFGTLRTLFGERLAFGTAGLRGPLRPGPAGMNRVLVAQAAAGFAAYLLDNHETIDGSNQPSIVIGYDGRHNSDMFARDSAEIMAGAGIRTVLLPEPLPTPVLAFAVRHLGTTAGVMVTASHNPAADNGYKVYLGGAASDPARGAQIISPVDTAIAASIAEIAGTVTIGDLQRSTGYSTEDGSVLSAYIAVTAAVRGVPGPTVPFTYTAMHGVGWRTFRAVLDAAGINQPDLVVDQADPDPDFPTVAFPNPEEIGALDRAFASALVSGSSLVIANDPDADRLAVAIPDDDEFAGFRRLSGNEVGQLLGWRAARLAAASDSTGSTTSNGVLARSLVSSPAIAAVAAHYGLDSVETLTGFKWLSRVPGLVFGYEEALGYLVNPEDLRDKDGISAAMAILALAAELQENGSSIAQHLADFHELFGYHLSEQISLRVTDVAVIAGTMAGLRADPPAAVGGLVVLRVDDLRDGFEDLPPSDVLRFQLDGGSRMIVRPSGTEPKLKIYLDVVGDSADAAEKLLQEVSDGARALLA